MNRRRFLQMLSAGAFGAMALDVEKLLWVPGAKTIFLPPPKPVLSFVGLVPGDIFTIDGVYALNPITGEATKWLQDFILADSVTGEFYPRRPDISWGIVHGVGQ
jgi:hypothetical protein